MADVPLSRAGPRGAGVDARYVDLASGPDALWEALTERTRLVWFETPSNPRLKVVDIAATVGDRRPARGGRRPSAARRGRQHLRLAGPPAAAATGADIVFHSATKYLAGHSDTILGVAVTSDAAVAERLRFLQNAMGAVPGPLDCFLVLRGLRTLHLRDGAPRRECRGVAEYLRAGPTSPRLLPGVRRHGLVPPDAAAAGRSDRGGTGDRDRRGDRLFTLAESLGGVDRSSRSRPR